MRGTNQGVVVASVKECAIDARLIETSIPQGYIIKYYVK
jgi:hypothetical protein